MGRIALVVTTMIWGTSFVLLKNTLDVITPLTIMAIRFLGSALLMLIIGFKDLKKLDKDYVKGGIIMGLCVFCGYLLQTFGLEYTTPGKNAFLTATYCVIVPFLAWFIEKKRPDKFNLSAAVICIVGIGLVSLQDDLTVGIGDMLTAFCGFFFALHMIYTGKYAENRSPILLNMIQFAVVGVLALILALIFEEPPAAVSFDVVLTMIYLCVMCTAVCYQLQTFGQKYATASSVAVIMPLESVFGTVVSVIFYGEHIGFRLFTGFVLIFAAIIISETKLGFLRKSRAARDKAYSASE